MGDMTLIVGGFTACGAAITALWAVTQKHYANTERKLEDCEKDRMSLWQVLWKHLPMTCDLPYPGDPETVRNFLSDTADKK